MFLSLGVNAFACSCISVPLSARKIVDSELVIKGKIIDKEEIGLMPGQDKETTFFQNHYKYTVLVKDLFRGLTPKNEIIVYSSTSGSLCGVNYKVGAELFLFINSWEGNYQTGLCSGNISVKYATRKEKRIFKKYSCILNKRKHKNVEGQLVAEGNLRKGVPDGEWNYYFENGKLEMKGTFENGMKQGEWIRYYSDASWEKFAKKNNLSDVPPENRVQRIMIFDKGVFVEDKYYSLEDY